MFRQFKEKNKNLLRLKNQRLKLNKYQWFCKWRFIINRNLNLLFINLLLMIQSYISWEGEGA